MLPSDARFRSDLQELSKGDVAKAQQCKEDLENAQRKDARLRAEAKPNKKTGWFS